MRSEPLRLAVLAALLLAGPPVAAEVDAGDAGAPADAGGAALPDAGDKECPADERRERLAAEAAHRRLAKLAEDVTVRTVGEAEAIAAEHFRRQHGAWIAAAMARADALPDPYEKQEPGPEDMSRGLCAALAARDAGACDDLAAPDEARSCRAWLALEAATRDGEAGCDGAPEALGGACRAVFTGDATPCAGLDGDARAACDQSAEALAGLDAACATPDVPSRCLWGLLLRGLAAGRDACDAVAPGPTRTLAAHRRLDALCRAVLSGQPGRCGLVEDVPRPRPLALEVWSDGAVLPGWREPRLVALVRTTLSSACHVTVRVDGVEEAWTRVARLGGRADLVFDEPLPPAVAPGTAVRIDAVCAPIIAW